MKLEVAKKLAKQLDGMEYGDDIPQDVIETAKEHGLVICTGYSDDNIELYGAYTEEVGISST